MKKELRVYLVSREQYEGDKEIESLTDLEFIEESERQGNVFSTAGFQQAFNNDEVSPTDCYMRFLEYSEPDSKDDKIRRIKDILDTWGSTSVSEIGMGSSPVLSSTGTNKNNVSVLVEDFYVQSVKTVTYQNETEIDEDDVDYEDLPEEIIDEILEQVEYYEVDCLKTEERCKG